MNLSEQITSALFRPSKYNDMLKFPRKKFVRFVILLTLFMSFITFAIPMSATIAGFGGFEKLFNTNLKTIKYENGVLSLEKPFKMNVMGSTFIIDTTEEAVSAKELKTDGKYVTVGAKKISILGVDSGTIINGGTYYLGDAFFVNFDRVRLLQMIPVIYVYLVLVFVFKAAFYFGEYALYALFLAFLLNIMKKNQSFDLSYKQLFVICFYAQTFMMIVNSVNESLGIMGGFLINLIGLFYTIRNATAGVMSTVQPKE